MAVDDTTKQRLFGCYLVFDPWLSQGAWWSAYRIMQFW